MVTIIEGEAMVRVQRALDAIARGGMVVVIDDASRENEGDLVLAAQYVTADAINFMARHGRGLICVPMTARRLDVLDLPPMVEVPEDRMRTAFTVSVDARHGVSTGISAADRARTVQVLVDEASVPADLARPGHIFPIRAEDDGVLSRPGHTEAAVDLTRLRGLAPVGIICEILRDDGSMMRVPELMTFSAAYGLPVMFIADLIHYRTAQAGRATQRAPEREPLGRW